MTPDDEEDPIVAASLAQRRVIADGISREKVIKRIQSNRRVSVDGRNRTSSMDSNEADSSFDDLEGKDEAFATPTKPHGLDIREVLFEAIPEPYSYSTEFQRVHISEVNEPTDRDVHDACLNLKKALALREKYLTLHPPAPQDEISPDMESALANMSPKTPERKSVIHPDDYRRRPQQPYHIFDIPLPDAIAATHANMIDGIMIVTNEVNADSSNTTGICPVHSYNEFVRDYQDLRSIIYSGTVTSHSYQRIELLNARFNLHKLLNDARESDATKSVPHRDFYNVRKVDTHVHHSACMNQKHLLRYIKHKLRHQPDDKVIYRDGKVLTLGEVFQTLGLTAYDLSIDTLDMHAHNTFCRFDRFNLKYNPIGESRLREIFLKTDNYIKGKYLAEITREVIGDLEASKYQLAEWRISIYGRKYDEWTKLAKWFYDNELAHKNIRWMIQVPRLFDIYRKAGDVESFGQLLYNIFHPLFMISIDPKSNPALHYFLETIVGIDSVDDESKPEMANMSSTHPKPQDWTHAENPPYAYWMYYMYANLCVLNQLRASRGLRTFQFRPHCGEAGPTDHLISNFLVAHQINHGILLRRSPGLCYLYYLAQIGIAMSPLSNNKLFLDYNKNPFPKFFAMGMNVSLSSDDPLMLHYTKEALVEEYAVATQVWKLSTTDQCEIARNSVLQSGLEAMYKRLYLGKDYSDIRETNVPTIRLTFRQETMNQEVQLLDKYSQ